MEFSDSYMDLNRRLLGRVVTEKSKLNDSLEEGVFYDLNMGYYTLETRGPFDSAGYFEAENNFEHEFSMKSLCYIYSYHKLNEIISLDDYLTKPTFLVNEMIEGLIEGKEERRKADEQEKKKAEAKAKGQGAGDPDLGDFSSLADELNKHSY